LASRIRPSQVESTLGCLRLLQKMTQEWESYNDNVSPDDEFLIWRGPYLHWDRHLRWPMPVRDVRELTKASTSH
jgi:hypothetical protein